MPTGKVPAGPTKGYDSLHWEEAPLTLDPLGEHHDPRTAARLRGKGLYRHQ
jgi:hypothetical protein